MGIILYSNHCPKCGILKQKLISKEITYTEINDIDLMLSKGFLSMPVLEVDGVTMDFSTANIWVNDRKEEDK